MLVFLLYRRTAQRPEKRRRRLLDYALLALGAAPILYLFFNYEYVVTRIYYIDDLTAADMIFGVILTSHRARSDAPGHRLGAADHRDRVPGLWSVHRAARAERLLDQLFMTTEGIFGIPLSVSAAYVLIFVLFGSFMERTGTGQLFMDFAMSLTGHTAGGPARSRSSARACSARSPAARSPT